MSEDSGQILIFETMGGTCRVYETEHKNGPIRVMDVEGVKQSATFLGDDYCDLPYSYTRDYDIMFYALGEEHARDILLLGCGGYSYPKHLIAHWPQTRLTCVEIDPVVTRIARTHFFLDRLIEEHGLEESGRLELVEDEARHFLEHDGHLHDVIINDCFNGGEPVMELATREAAQLIHERLRRGGLYLSNVIGAVEGPGSHVLRSIMRTLLCEFKYVRVLPGEPGRLSDCNNNIVIATDGQWRFTGALELEQWELSQAVVLEDSADDSV